jgi:alkanesulfonate monooxygenase SsuD/methylene tetrahydromethanopterin reductase-like flavin-dependent oxidoreductase (luciferase family)
MMEYSFIGSGVKVKEELQAFVTRTGVNELMVASHIYDLEAKKKSYRLVAPMFKKADVLFNVI